MPYDAGAETLKTILLCQKLLNYAGRVPQREIRRQKVREEIAASSLFFLRIIPLKALPMNNSSWFQSSCLFLPVPESAFNTLYKYQQQPGSQPIRKLSSRSRPSSPHFSVFTTPDSPIIPLSLGEWSCFLQFLFIYVQPQGFFSFLLFFQPFNIF